MRYWLMHKDSRVALVEIDGDKMSCIRIMHSDLVPFGARLNSIKFSNWWKMRAIPVTRGGVINALQVAGIMSTSSLLEKNLALSLNDCYWIKPVDSNLRWGDVSLFSNDFVDVFGELTFHSEIGTTLENTPFKSATSSGEVKKKWCIKDNGVRFLVKGNSGSSYQQSLNEVFATLLHTKQRVVPFVKYTTHNIVMENGVEGLGCACDCFCSEDIEFISYWEISEAFKQAGSDNYFQAALKNLKEIGIDEYDLQRFFDYQTMSDYVMSNTDRHFNNFGILREASSLEVISMAPIYDTGNSMFFRNVHIGLQDIISQNTTSFSKYEIDLLKNVKDRNILDLGLLPSHDEFVEIYQNDILINSERIEKLWEAFQIKIDLLDKFQHGNDIWKMRSKYYRSKHKDDSIEN